MKNFAVILAGGVGKRVGADIPKQFIKLSDTPLIILTIRKILSVKSFDKIFIAIHPEWYNFLQEMLNNYQIDDTKIVLVNGGKERLDSIENVLSKITQCHLSSEQDIVVICDAVRPFVSKEILQNSIDKSREYGACVCTIPAADTMLYVKDNVVTAVPPRKNIFHGQAPDSFRVSILNNALRSLTEDEKKLITGTAQICVIKNIPVYTIEGNVKNIKITTPEDIKIAENILKIGELK